MESVNLELCWSWHCRACGAVNYEDGEEIEEIHLGPTGVTDDGDMEEGALYSAPETVTCAKCGTEYAVDDEAPKEEV